MILTPYEAAAYLRNAGLVPESAFVDGSVTIQDVSRRNRNLRVNCGPSPSYFLKQGIGPKADADVATEAAVYAALQATGSPFAAHLPRLHRYDEGEKVLITELLDAEDVEQHHQRLGRFPSGVGRAIGEALGLLHTIDVPISGLSDITLKRPPAWALSFHHLRLEDLRDISPGNLEAISLVQQNPALAGTFDALHADWRIEALCHFDLKWDNILVPLDGGSSPSGCKLVDWEAAGYGDPAWDVACAFASWLAFWVRSMTLAGSETAQRLPERARYPLETMHSSISAFWHAYSRIVGEPRAAETLPRAIAYLAARLAEEAIAQSQLSMRASARTRLLIQLSLNVSQRPGQVLALVGLDGPPRDP